MSRAHDLIKMQIKSDSRGSYFKTKHWVIPFHKCDCDQDYCVPCEIKFRTVVTYRSIVRTIKRSN